MIIEEVRTRLAGICPQAFIFDKSIIGVSLDGRIIYDYNKMIDELMYDDNISEEESIEFIEYNTFRALFYMANAPIIVENAII